MSSVRSTGIPEDLGQVQYILTDKTGTLTENVMLLKKCGVRGRAYGEATGDVVTGEHGTHLEESQNPKRI